MNLIKVMMISAVLYFPLMVSGMETTQDDQEITDQQYCELEAEEAGMIDESDIQRFIEQCMEEIQSHEGNEDKRAEDGDNDENRIE